eukprot:TRINITY_DN20103_c0_g1_i1.p1 TRINITY_DN20103_c0_g1~~TRINITY_DN20103_c0_g1_i1.p1  ORF type:complete len:464 (+),score=72.34 TRINITY_DN20103_c0_g1_i1:40-1392(+)
MRAPLVAALWASAASASSWGLYADSPHVVELPGTLPWWADSDAQGCPYVVVFYASWCGHCRHYAPTYKAVAEEMERLGNPYGLAALDCAEYTDYCDKMGIRSFPTVVHYPTGSGTQTDTGGEVKLKGRDADAVSVRRLVRTAFSAGAAPARPSLSEAGWRTCRESRGRLRLLRKSPPHPPANAQLPASALARVWLSDLVQATHVALSDEAVAAGCLQDPQRRAVLADFVRLCASAFPHAETRAQLASLPQLLSDPNVPVDRVQWRSAVAFLSPPGVRWEGCRGSSQSYRGYTCGLWQVYHALLANTASGEKVRALNVISRWVLATFGCEVCRKHFERESASIAEVTTDDAAVLGFRTAGGGLRRRRCGCGGTTTASTSVSEARRPTTPLRRSRCGLPASCAATAPLATPSTSSGCWPSSGGSTAPSRCTWAGRKTPPERSRAGCPRRHAS